MPSQASEAEPESRLSKKANFLDFRMLTPGRERVRLLFASLIRILSPSSRVTTGS